MIKQVENLGAELDIHALGKLGVFENGKVHIFEIRPDDDIATQIPEVEDPGARYGQSEDRIRRAGTHDSWIANRIGEPKVGTGFTDGVD